MDVLPLLLLLLNSATAPPQHHPHANSAHPSGLQDHDDSSAAADAILVPGFKIKETALPVAHPGL